MRALKRAAELQGTDGAVTRCGMCAIAFRADGLALAAYSRLSGYVYVWTLQPAWQARMSVSAAPKQHPPSIFPIGHTPAAAPRAAHLGPFRVVAAPPVATGAGEGPDTAFALCWAGNGGAVELWRHGVMLGSIPVQCP